MDGPYLAAVVVRYPSGWVVHPLADDPAPALDGIPLKIGGRAGVKPRSVLTIGGDRIRIEPDPDDLTDPAPAGRPPLLQLAVRGPDNLFESRSVEHDLLVGRLPVCEVCYPHETKLSRLAALFAADGGTWYAVVLSRGPIARNRHRVDDLTPLDGDDILQIGPFYFTCAPPPGRRGGRPAAERRG
jgi:hypothetical protein